MLNKNFEGIYIGSGKFYILDNQGNLTSGDVDITVRITKLDNYIYKVETESPGLSNTVALSYVNNYNDLVSEDADGFANSTLTLHGCDKLVGKISGNTVESKTAGHFTTYKQ